MNAIVIHLNAFWLANRITLGLGKQDNFYFPLQIFLSISEKKKIRCGKTLSRVKVRVKILLLLLRCINLSLIVVPPMVFCSAVIFT